MTETFDAVQHDHGAQPDREGSESPLEIEQVDSPVRLKAATSSVGGIGASRRRLFFFFSREEPRMHVHVSHPEIVLADLVGLSARQIADAQDMVERHTGKSRDAWIPHFGA